MCNASVGFGVDAQYSLSYAGGIEGMVSRFRHRLSHISVVSLRTPQAAAAFCANVACGLPVIHHLSNIAPADPGGPDIVRLAELNCISEILNARWCCEDIGIWSLGPYQLPYFAPPLFEADIADLVAIGIVELQAATQFRFLAETPSCSFVAGRISLGEFFSRLVKRSACEIVLDVGHVFSYALYTDTDPIEVLMSLPLSHVREIHVAGGKIAKNHNWRYIDTHTDPILPAVEDLFIAALDRCEHLCAVTFELGCGLNDVAIDENLTRIEAAIAKTSFVPLLDLEAR
jgi:uncharacterized protein (UPF0276 family)